MPSLHPFTFLMFFKSCMYYTNPSKLIFLEILSGLLTHLAVYMRKYFIGVVLSAVTVIVCATLSAHLDPEPFVIPSFYQLWYYNMYTVQRCNVAHVSPFKTISPVLPTLAVKCNVQRCNVAHRSPSNCFPHIMPQLILLLSISAT